MQGEKGERYQFTALLWKLAHQDLIGGGICHAPRVQRHLGLQGKAQAETSSFSLMLMLMLMLISSGSGLISTSPDSVSSPLMYCRMLLSHQNLLIAKILHKIEEKMRNVILCKYDTFCHNNLALTLWAAHSHKSRFAAAVFSSRQFDLEVMSSISKRSCFFRNQLDFGKAQKRSILFG